MSGPPMSGPPRSGPPASARSTPRLGRTFLVVWLGQLVSQLGSSMTAFAMSIVVFQADGSVTDLAMVLLAANLPGIVLAPMAGAYVDRWNRRTVMLVADSVSALVTLALAFVLIQSGVVLWLILVVVGVGSIAAAFQEPAYSAAVPTLVPQSQLGRANGLVQLGPALSVLAAPVVAAGLLVTAGIATVLILDLVTFALAVTSLLFVRFPDVVPETDQQTSLWSEIRSGIAFLLDRRGLLVFLGVAAGLNFFLSISNVLWTPLILSYGDEIDVGTALSASGLAMVTGAVVMSAWGGPKRKVRGMTAMMVLGALAIVVAGLRPSLLFAIIGGVVLMFFVPIVNGTSQSIWQVKVPLHLQGRVFAVRRMTAVVATPISFILAGPLADRIFEPLMSTGGPVSGTLIETIWGTGPGRGIGLLFAAVGFGCAITALSGYANPRFRHLEREIPDVATPAEEPAAQN